MTILYNYGIILRISVIIQDLNSFIFYIKKEGYKMLIYLAAIETEEEKTKFEQLYQEYNQVMYWAAFGILKEQYQAEDVVSQALFKIIDHLDKIGEVRSIRTKVYIVTITEHTAIDYYRKRKREQTQSIDDLEVYSEYSSTFEHGENDVLSTINSLPINYAIVLRLRYSQGYSDKEIADMLEITQGNVRTRVKRAKRKLAQILEERGVEF
jgi:RNA polymerase sigma-70 factor (ECF subfamily)